MKPEFLYAGDAILTVESSKESQSAHGFRTHYTYRVEAHENGRTFFVSFMVGKENTDRRSYRYLCMLDKGGTVRLTQGSKFAATSDVYRIFRRAVAAITVGRAGLDHVEATGWKIHHAGLCGRCRRLLTCPASVETGIGPECETYVNLGIEPEDVPCVDIRGRQVARLQYAYWMNGDDGVILHAIADACEDAFPWDREKCELYARATMKLMRKHKKGKKLPKRFLDIVEAM